MERGPDYIHISCVGRLTPVEEEMLREVNAAVGQSNSMLGGECAVDILLMLSPIVLNNLTKIIIQLSRDRRRTRIKTPGFEITDVDGATAKEIAALLLERMVHRQPPDL